MARRKCKFWALQQPKVWPATNTPNFCIPKNYSQDPFAKKELYAIKAPSFFAVRNAGKTIVNRTAGQSTYWHLLLFIAVNQANFCCILQRSLPMVLRAVCSSSPSPTLTVAMRLRLSARLSWLLRMFRATMLSPTSAAWT